MKQVGVEPPAGRIVDVVIQVINHEQLHAYGLGGVVVGLAIADRCI